MNNIEHRPWGQFTILATGNGYQVKEICVNPGARFSYQYHTKRAEHWYVLSGTGRAIIEDQEITLEAGQSIDIPPGAKHRLGSASTKEEVVFIEIQTGEYFGEDDIVRLADDYNRVQV